MAPAYQIIEINLDAEDNEISQFPAWSFDTLETAVDQIENVLSRWQTRGCASDGSYWWDLGMNGDEVRFKIEGV
jgi:hypothetical protein